MHTGYVRCTLYYRVNTYEKELSTIHLDILDHIINDGESAKQVAAARGRSHQTVKHQMSEMSRIVAKKTGKPANLINTVIYVLVNGLVELEPLDSSDTPQDRHNG